MKTSFNLRLPPELCNKIEHEAKMQKLSINQYILYTLTKVIAYNEAAELLKNKIENIDTSNALNILNEIPSRKPLDGDEID